MISLKPVVEIPYGPFEREYGWELADFTPGHFLPLSDQLSLPEIGVVVAHLMDYNHAAALADVLNSEDLILPGGVGVFQNNQPYIMPGCCCGLECWREWEGFAKSGRSPWCGHDPEAVLTISDSSVSIEQLCHDETRHCAIALSDYVNEIVTVEKSLLGFVYALDAWGYAVGLNEARTLAVKFNECFDIGARW